MTQERDAFIGRLAQRLGLIVFWIVAVAVLVQLQFATLDATISGQLCFYGCSSISPLTDFMLNMIGGFCLMTYLVIPMRKFIKRVRKYLSQFEVKRKQ